MKVFTGKRFFHHFNFFLFIFSSSNYLLDISLKSTNGLCVAQIVQFYSIYELCNKVNFPRTWIQISFFFSFSQFQLLIFKVSERKSNHVQGFYYWNTFELNLQGDQGNVRFLSENWNVSRWKATLKFNYTISIIEISSKFGRIISEHNFSSIRRLIFPIHVMCIQKDTIPNWFR